MLNISKCLCSERLMRSLTGLDTTSFNQLASKFDLALLKKSKTHSRNLKRKLGAGRKHSLATSKAQLFYILFYMKCYPTFDLAGIIFDVDRSRACRWVEDFAPLLEQALGYELVLPKRKITSVAEFMSLFPGVKDLFIDGTERPVSRPKNYKRSKKHYSGKKNRHTKNNLVFNDDSRRILILSETRAGHSHDMQLMKKNQTVAHLPQELAVWVDLGFVGMDKYTPAQVVIGHKRSKKKPLTDEQKAENKLISGIRICSEHAIGGLKRLRCCRDIWRNHNDKLADQLMCLAAGIWNLHLKYAA